MRRTLFVLAGILLCALPTFASGPALAGHLQGQLVDEHCLPAANVLIMAATYDKEVFTARTDALGRFSFQALPSGEILIVASREVTAGSQTARTTADLRQAKSASVTLSLPVPMNFCSCNCPWDPRRIWSIDAGDCSNCPSCGS